MSEETKLNDLDTKCLMAHFKFLLTEHTLDQYASMTEILGQQKSCEQKCLKRMDAMSKNEFLDCVKDCSTGTREVLKLQQ